MADKITAEQIRLIKDLASKGHSPQTIADTLGISKRTVQRYKNTPAATEATTGDSLSPQQDYTTQVASMSSTAEKIKHQHDIDKVKSRWFSFIIYPESAPPNWLELLINTGLPVAVSPPHDKDVYAKDSDPYINEATGELMPAGSRHKKGDIKKIHIHVLVDNGKNVPYRHMRELTQMLNAPMPIIVKSPHSMFDYLTHTGDNESCDKYVYTDPAQTYNGFTLPIEDEEKARLRKDIQLMIYTEVDHSQ